MENVPGSEPFAVPGRLQLSNGVGLMKDCPDAMVSVRLGLTND
jgi:hypothetical protein